MAKWLYIDTAYPEDEHCAVKIYGCSVCGEIVEDRHGRPRFCPFCGDIMYNGGDEYDRR